MSFSSDWLALREPADAAARDAGLVAALADWAGERPLLAVDLGCGTGSTFRALSPRLPSLRWRLVDHDPALLAEAERRTGAETRRADLAADPAGPLEGAGIVTASALYDLVSAAWLDRFVAALPSGAAVYAALSYDGVETWEPSDPAEPAALAAFNAHQRTDKGFGPALGPDATAALAERLAARGWRVTTAPSPWRLGAAERALIRALAEGSAQAVAETGALAPVDLARWAQARARAERVTVGHLDLLALPPE